MPRPGRPHKPSGYAYTLTDTPASQPVFGTATWNSGWNSEGTANGVTGVVAANADNRNGELGNGAPALMTLEAEYDTSQGYSASFSKTEAVTKSFKFGVNATFLGIGSDTSFGISGTSTWGSGATDSHVTTTSQDESFTFTTPVGKEYQGQVWHSVETVELPFTIHIHVNRFTEGQPTHGVPIDPLGYAVLQPIGPVFAWAHDQGPGGPAGDDYVNYAQDPTNPNAGIYTLHGTLTAYSGGAFYVQVLDHTDAPPSDPSPPPSATGVASVRQSSPAPADGAGADAPGQDGDGPSPSPVSVPLDYDTIDGLAKAYWQSHFGAQYGFQFHNAQPWRWLATADAQPAFGTPVYTPTTLSPPFYALVNNIDGLGYSVIDNVPQEGLSLGTKLTYSQQAGFETTQTTGGAVDKSFEQKVSADFPDVGGANADFKLDGTFSWTDSTATSRSTTATETVGPFSVTSNPGVAKQLRVTHVQEAIAVPYETVVHVSGYGLAHTIDLGTGQGGPEETVTAGDLFQWVHDQGPNGPAGSEYALYSRDPDHLGGGLLTLSGSATVYSNANASVYSVGAEDVTQAIQQNPDKYPPTTPVPGEAFPAATPLAVQAPDL